MNRGVVPFILPAFVIAAFFAALMPFSAYEAESFGVAFFILSGLALFMLGATNGFSIPKSPLMALAGLFWALAAISVFASQIPYISFLYFCFFSALPLTLLITMAAPDKVNFFRLTGWGLAFVIGGLSVSCLAQYFFFPEMLHRGSAAHLPLADPNGMAGILSIGFICGAGVMLSSQSRAVSNAALGFCILVFAALLTTGSRGAFYAMIPALLILLFLSPELVKKHRRCLLALGVSMAGLFALSAFFYPEVSPVSEVLTFSESTGPSMMMRAGIWESTWRMVQDHWLTGTGIGTFFLHYPEYRHGDVSTAGLMAHNDPLQFAAEMGIAAPVVFYAFIVLALWKTWKVLVQREGVERLAVLTPFCALGAMILHTHITFHFYVLPMLMLTGLLTGYWFYQTHPEYRAVNFRSNFSFFTFKTILAAPLIAVIVVFFCVHGGYILTERGKDFIAAGKVEAYADAVNRAGRLSFGTNEQAYILAATVPMGVLESTLKEISTEEAQRFFGQGYGFLEKAEALNPRLAAILYYKARLIKSASAHADIKTSQSPQELLEQALTIDPMHLSSRLMLAGLYKERGDKVKAYEVLKAGMKWRYGNQDPTAYYETTAWAALDQSDMKTHVEAMQKMLLSVKVRLQQKVDKPLSGNFRVFLPGE